MKIFMLATFALLGLGLYYFSGGSDFTAKSEARRQTAIETTILPDQAAKEATTEEIEQVLESILADFSGAESSAAAIGEIRVAVITPPEANAEATAAFVSQKTPMPDANTWLVAGSRVNVRAGPGTSYGIITSLERDAAVIRVGTSANGWANIRFGETLRIGWMSAKLLTKPNEDALQ